MNRAATSRLAIFGAGYSACASARRVSRRFDSIRGTTRSPGKVEALAEEGIEALLLDSDSAGRIESAFGCATHLLISAPPCEDGDPALLALGEAIETAADLRWICYFSTVGVYGDHGGGWVDERSECRPASSRSRLRLRAERGWRELAERRGIPLSILRLSGIYGPGRNAFVKIREGRARRIVKPGQVFNRIHRDDIASAFALACEREADGIFNVSDDLPAPPQEVISFACALAGVEPPAEEDFATANLSPSARSFYGESKRVSNSLSKSALGVRYEWPNYRFSLSRMWRERSL